MTDVQPSEMNQIDELRREREALNLPAAGPDRPASNGRGIAERAGDEPDEYAEPAEELFVLHEGRRVPISKLIPRGSTVEYKVNLNAKSMKGSTDMGLLSYDDAEMTLVVRVRQGKVTTDPTYTDDGDLEKVGLYVNLKPQSIYLADSPEGRALLGLNEA